MGTLQEDHGDDGMLYGDETERLRHLNAIQTVAGHTGAPVEEVGRLYEELLEGLKRSVRVRDFLPILVSKKVAYVLSVRRGKTHS